MTLLSLAGIAAVAARLHGGGGSSGTAALTLGPASGRIRPLLGLNGPTLPSGEPGNPDMTSLYQVLGVTQLRTHDYYGPLDMSTIYPDTERDPSDPSSYDFEASDRYFEALLHGGFEPYLRIGNSYNAPPPYPPPDRCPANLANWTSAALEVVRHYNDASRWGGTRLRCVEIWNEPDNRQFWDCDRSRFFELFERAAVALKAAFPELQIGGPGFTPAGFLSPQGRAYTEAFLSHLEAQAVPLDFLSWHLYSNDPAEFAQACAYYRQQLDLRGFAHVAQHVSEWNTEVRDGTPGDEALALRAGAMGASLMTAAWISMQDGGVEESCFYRGADPALDVPTFYGLFYADGRPKKMALAFSLWARLAAHPVRREVTGQVGSPLSVLAGSDDRGEIAVLIANASEEDASWSLAFGDGRPALRRYEVSAYEVGDAWEEVHPFNPSGLKAPIGAHTSHLVLLTPLRIADPAPNPTEPPVR
jgi:hypothetical protein